jgi:4-amino-4-deoxy-L-arabinose transferase-like glycosyltransferase
MKFKYSKISFPAWFQIILVFALLVYALGIFVTLMEPDAVVYADIPMEMVNSGNYSEIRLKGNDWLDKPHFQFWLTAVSYKIFGINNFGYKFPAILFSMIAVLYVFLFGKRFYSIKHGTIAALILMTAQHFITSNNDVRAEPYLAALTIFSLYYFVLYLDKRKFIFMILCSIGMAGLLMTKGLYTLLPVVSGIGLSLFYEKKWKEIFHWQWLVILCITLLFTSPTLIAYYNQFDMHPEKVIFGETGVSGIKFFLWDSQWGRFSNTGPIQGEGDPLFFLHTMLWAFAPWALLAYSGIFVKIKDIVRGNYKNENYTIFGFLVTFIIISLSKFQLPHYLNQLFPFMAIITSWVILTRIRNIRFLKTHFYLMMLIMVIFVLLLIVLHVYYFENLPNIDVLIIVMISIFISVFILIRERTLIKKLLIPPAIIILAVNYYLNRQFYPSLLHFQSESEMAYYVKTYKLPVDDLVTFEEEQWITDFQLKKVIPQYNEEDLSQINLTGRLVFTNPKGIKILENYGYSIEPVKSFKDFHVTTLNAEFLNKKTRANTLSDTFLVYIQ